MGGGLLTEFDLDEDISQRAALFKLNQTGSGALEFGNYSARISLFYLLCLQ
jgi:hypothetical protein